MVLHLYKQGIPLCALINQYMTNLSANYPNVKFLKSISTTCIPNYPDRNLPTLFVYYEGDMKKQLGGPHHFRGMTMTSDEFEFILGKHIYLDYFLSSGYRISGIFCLKVNRLKKIIFFKC